MSNYDSPFDGETVKLPRASDGLVLIPEFVELMANAWGVIVVRNSTTKRLSVRLSTPEVPSGLDAIWEPQDVQLEAGESQQVRLKVRRGNPLAYLLGGRATVRLLARTDEGHTDSPEIFVEVGSRLLALIALLVVLLVVLGVAYNRFSQSSSGNTVVELPTVQPQATETVNTPATATTLPTESAPTLIIEPTTPSLDSTAQVVILTATSNDPATISVIPTATAPSAAIENTEAPLLSTLPPTSTAFPVTGLPSCSSQADFRCIKDACDALPNWEMYKVKEGEALSQILECTTDALDEVLSLNGIPTARDVRSGINICVPKQPISDQCSVRPTWQP